MLQCDGVDWQSVSVADWQPEYSSRPYVPIVLMLCSPDHRCNKRFYVFFIQVTLFTFFNVFFIFSTFFYIEKNVVKCKV